MQPPDFLDPLIESAPGIHEVPDRSARRPSRPFRKRGMQRFATQFTTEGQVDRLSPFALVGDPDQSLRIGHGHARFDHTTKRDVVDPLT